LGLIVQGWWKVFKLRLRSRASLVVVVRAILGEQECHTLSLSAKKSLIGRGKLLIRVTPQVTMSWGVARVRRICRWQCSRREWELKSGRGGGKWVESWLRSGGWFEESNTLRQCVGAQTLRDIMVIAKVLIHLPILLKEARAALNRAIERRGYIHHLACR
jgi:hypothetical protein